MPAGRTPQRRRGTGLVRELGIVLFAGFVYAAVRQVTEGNAAAAVQRAHRLFRLEQWLGIDVEKPGQGIVVQHVALRDLFNWVYIYGHWPVIAVTAICLYRWRRDRYTRLRNAVFLSGFVSFAFFALTPTAPPRLAGLGFTDTITRWSSSYRILQPPQYTNLYASMPSLHFGWDLLAGIALFGATSFIVVRIFAVVMPVLMGMSVVLTGNHFVLDPIAGACIVLAAWFTVVAWEKRDVVAARRARARARARPRGTRLVPVRERRAPARRNQGPGVPG